MLHFIRPFLPQRTRRAIQRIKDDYETATRIKRALRAVGYDPMHWVRHVCYQECFPMVEALNPETLDVCEISALYVWKERFKYKSYTELNYPAFDICAGPIDRTFDLIIADNVFEQLKHPLRAAQNVLNMLRPGGHFLTMTPFLIRIHRIPVDCTRWTEDGIRYLLEDAGFDAAGIKTGSWGSRACVRANFNTWARVGFGRNMRNETDFPVTVWALARASTIPLSPPRMRADT